MFLPSLRYYPSPALYVGGEAAPFDPSSLSPALWFDASDTSTMYQERTGASATTPSGVGDPVGSWKNKGSVGGWATAASDAARPVRQSDGSLLFDGVDDTLGFTNYNIASAQTYYRAFSRGSSGILSMGFARNDANTPYTAYWYSNNTIYQYIGDNAVSYSAGTATGSYVATSKRDASTQSMYLNGALIAGPTSCLAAGYFNNIGRKQSEYTNGKIFQALAFAATHNDTDRGSMEAWLAAKNGALL